MKMSATKIINNRFLLNYIKTFLFYTYEDYISFWKKRAFYHVKYLLLTLFLETCKDKTIHSSSVHNIYRVFENSVNSCKLYSSFITRFSSTYKLFDLDTETLYCSVYKSHIRYFKSQILKRLRHSLLFYDKFCIMKMYNVYNNYVSHVNQLFLPDVSDNGNMYQFIDNVLHEYYNPDFHVI